MVKIKTIDCERCGGACYREEGSISLGYGTTPEGKNVCYECCGKLDEEAMRAGNEFTCYLEETTGTLTNWPGTFKLKAQSVKKVHSIVYVSLFWDDSKWHGKLGYRNQLVTMRRKAKTPRPSTDS